MYIKQIITYVKHNKKQTLIDIKNFLFKISFLVLLLITVSSKININQQELQIKQLKQEYKSYIKSTKNKLKGYNSEINKYNIKIEGVEKANEELTNKNKQLENDKQKLNSEIDKLKEENSNFKAKRKEVDRKSTVNSGFEKDNITVKDEFYSKDEIKKEKVENDTFDAVISFYTSDFASTGKNPSDPDYGITSSGKKARANHTVAMDNSIYPYGTVIEIEGLGQFVNEDTGGAIKGKGRIDVFVNSESEAYRLGKQTRKVRVIK